MGKKITNIFLFAAVLAAAVGMTVYVGRGTTGVMIYNFVFLGIILVIYLLGMLGGMFKMNSLSAAFNRAAEELTSIFKEPGKTDTKNLAYLQEIFDNHYLDKKMDNFTSSINKSQEGIGDLEEYINEEELDIHIHKRLLEMVPDILTSLGILGTFVGLVWGLKNFSPSDYAGMTNSVTSLVDGIKVAFLTSIYGISFSIVYTFGMRYEYSAMTESLQEFLEKFHAYVLPTAENESRNLLVSSQKLQTQAMKKMAEQFSVQMADSFEQVITPTFQKMNDSLDMLVASVTRCQQDAVRQILDEFMKELHGSFQMQFNDFNVALEKLTKAQKDNVEYTTALYQTMSQELENSYVKQEKAMKNMVTELGGLQSRYMSTATRIAQENQEIQKMQQQDYQHIVDYLKDAEKSAAKFWVACNQAMQKYVETAAQSTERATHTSQLSGELVKSNKEITEEFRARMQEFAEYQRLSYKTMEQVRRLLSDITVAKDNQDIYLSGGNTVMNESAQQMAELLAEQAEQQKALMEEMNKNIRELSKGSKKGKIQFVSVKGEIHAQKRRSEDHGFNVWRSYSDMMAGVLLLFVLIMCVTLFQAQKSYDESLKERDEKLKLQKEYTAELLAQQNALDEKEGILQSQDEQLKTQDEKLAALAEKLAEQAAQLKEQEKVLSMQKSDLDEKTALLSDQQAKIDNIIGVKAEVVESLQQEFAKNNVSVDIDSKTGALTLDANVMFDYDEAELTKKGEQALRSVLPIYCKVLLEKGHKPYLAEIIIDGYTDTDGDYAYNLELSQRRSLAVAQYLLDMQGEFLNKREAADLQDYLTVNGHSMANPILDADGNVDKDASRRVEVKFRLKDDEMIDELNRIMSSEETKKADKKKN